MIVCKYNKETKMFEPFVKDGPVNIVPHHTDNNIVVIRSGEQDIDVDKKDLLIICNKAGEKDTLKKYLEVGAKESKTLQKYYKRAEVFYHNFKHDVMIREDLDKEEPAPDNTEATNTEKEQEVTATIDTPAQVEEVKVSE